jgi:hypothetical protein
MSLRRIPISATKALHGHLPGAAGALECVVSPLVMHHAVLALRATRCKQRVANPARSPFNRMHDEGCASKSDSGLLCHQLGSEVAHAGGYHACQTALHRMPSKSPPKASPVSGNAPYPMRPAKPEWAANVATHNPPDCCWPGTALLAAVLHDE